VLLVAKFRSVLVLLSLDGVRVPRDSYWVALPPDAEVEVSMGQPCTLVNVIQSRLSISLMSAGRGFKWTGCGRGLATAPRRAPATVVGCTIRPPQTRSRYFARARRCAKLPLRDAPAARQRQKQPGHPAPVLLAKVSYNGAKKSPINYWLLIYWHQ